MIAFWKMPPIIAAIIVCTLHRGITVGVLEKLDPKAKLTSFEPRDPDRAGCLVEVSR